MSRYPYFSEDMPVVREINFKFESAEPLLPGRIIHPKSGHLWAKCPECKQDFRYERTPAGRLQIRSSKCRCHPDLIANALSTLGARAAAPMTVNGKHPTEEEDPPEVHPLDLTLVAGEALTKLKLAVPDALVPNVVYRGFSTLMAGDSKLGKSSLILRMMLAMASGGWWLDRECKEENRLPASRVLFLNFEDPLFLTQDRALKMMAPEGIPDNFMTMPVPYGYSLNQIVSWLAGAVERFKIDAVVLDPIAIAAEWEDEADNAKVALTFKSLQRLAAEAHIGVVAAHHVTKKPGEYGSNIRGASAIKANVIGWLLLERDKELIRLHGINKLTGQWDVLLDRREDDYSWWMVESSAGSMRNPQQVAKEEAKADLWATINGAPGLDRDQLADICELAKETCRRYLKELEDAGAIFSHPKQRNEGQRGNAVLGWFTTRQEDQEGI